MPELNHFKFFPDEWISGQITLVDMDAQGLFINICAWYWRRECDLIYEDIEKRFLVDDRMKKCFDKLINKDVLRLEDGKIHIEFLFNQHREAGHKHAIHVISGMQGGRGKKKGGFSEKKPAFSTEKPAFTKENKQKSENQKTPTTSIPEDKTTSEKPAFSTEKPAFSEKKGGFFDDSTDSTNSKGSTILSNNNIKYNIGGDIVNSSTVPNGSIEKPPTHTEFYKNQIEENKEKKLISQYKKFVDYLYENNPLKKPVLSMLLMPHQLSYEEFENLSKKCKVNNISLYKKVNRMINCPKYIAGKASLYMTLNDWIGTDIEERTKYNHKEKTKTQNYEK